MPSVFGKNSKQNELIERLDEEFLKVQKQYQLPIGDFPDLERFRENLKPFNFAEFPKTNLKVVAAMDEVLSEDLPKLMRLFPQGNPTLPNHLRNPFADYISTVGAGVTESGHDIGPDPWLWDNVDRSRYMIQFQSLNPVDGKISGGAAKPALMETQLPVADLGTIWGLADLTKDGYLDSDEFCLAMHLVKLKQSGLELPKILPESLVPQKGKV